MNTKHETYCLFHNNLAYFLKPCQQTINSLNMNHVFLSSSLVNEKKKTASIYEGMLKLLY